MTIAHLKPVPSRVEATSADQIPYQEAALDIWDKKYRLKTKGGVAIDQSMDDTYRRIARALADVEESDALKAQWYERFLWALRHGAIPAGRIISNAGARAHKPATSTINCTVSGTIQDSMDGILARVHEAGLTLKSGAGIGYDFSTLRPKGAYVSGAGAHTSGPLSFMDIYDRMCFTVSSAGGRRGAQMATFDVGHPDVMEFIRAKQENGRLRQFNLSLLITEAFIEAVKADAEWPLAFPLKQAEIDEEALDLADPDQVLWREWPLDDDYLQNEAGQTACRIYRKIPARRLWDMIMASTYDYAEPGFVLIDKVNEMNNNWFCEKIRATNPCVTADTWVHTADGPRQVHELIGRPFLARVNGEDHASGPDGFFKTATKPVVKLQTLEGHALRLTADHRVLRISRFTRHVTETEWCAAGDLRPGDRLVLNNHRGNAQWQGAYGFDEGYLIGLLVGDGTLQTDNAVLSVWTSPVAVNGEQPGLDGGDGIMAQAMACVSRLPQRSDVRGWQAVAGRGEYRLSLGSIKDLAEPLGMLPTANSITPAMEATSSQFHRGFLRGFFDAEGSVQGLPAKAVSVRLAQSDLERLQAVQRMLLRLGINACIHQDRRASSTSRLPDGKGGYGDYAIEPQHELVISGDNLPLFAARVGFADGVKQAKLQDLLAGYPQALNQDRFTAVVRQVMEDRVEDVYDVQIPGINRFDGNGLIAHNCGEQPLPPYGSCLLGSVNLTRFVRNPFSDSCYFDWEQYREVVAVFTRMLDNVVEINGLPLEQQRREITEKRRHGMGFLGLGSTLTLLRMRYGSPESLEFTERVSQEMALAGWREALSLAQEKGPAPIMEQLFTVTQAMLDQRPEMASDGYKVGDTVKGTEHHALYSRYMQQVATVAPELVEALAETGARFTHHTSIAPTGTISLSLANNASNGIEPSFAHHYARNVIREGRKTKEKVDVFSFELLAYRHLINAQAMPYAEEAEAQLPDYFITADDITPKAHVDVQAAAQRWIDSSISKTCNVPTDFPYEDFKDVYLYAYEEGLKGCTTFRFNPEAFQGVLVKEQDLANTTYRFELDNGEVVELKGNEEVEYDGETHTAANLFDALKEGYYGKF